MLAGARSLASAVSLALHTQLHTLHMCPQRRGEGVWLGQVSGPGSDQTRPGPGLAGFESHTVAGPGLSPAARLGAGVTTSPPGRQSRTGLGLHLTWAQLPQRVAGRVLALPSQGPGQRSLGEVHTSQPVRLCPPSQAVPLARLQHTQG